MDCWSLWLTSVLNHKSSLRAWECNPCVYTRYPSPLPQLIRLFTPCTEGQNCPAATLWTGSIPRSINSLVTLGCFDFIWIWRGGYDGLLSQTHVTRVCICKRERKKRIRKGGFGFSTVSQSIRGTRNISGTPKECLSCMSRLFWLSALSAECIWSLSLSMFHTPNHIWWTIISHLSGCTFVCLPKKQMFQRFMWNYTVLPTAVESFWNHIIFMNLGAHSCDRRLTIIKYNIQDEKWKKLKMLIKTSGLPLGRKPKIVDEVGMVHRVKEHCAHDSGLSFLICSIVE